MTTNGDQGYGVEDDALFAMTPSGARSADADLHLTGGVRVSVDHGFSSVTRHHLDATSWLDHVPGWLVGDDELMRVLRGTAAWEQRSRWMYTRTVVEPRLTAEHPDLRTADPLPVLTYLADALSARYERPFTRLWMNCYRDHDDSTGWHADRPAARTPEAVVPVLSLGATRRFLIRPTAGGRTTTVEVHGGDLVVMGGRCQRDHEHCVPRERHPTGPRVSLNFSVAPGAR